MSCVCNAFASVHCCLVLTCCERADLLALVCDVNCGFVTFPCDTLGQVWYLIISIPDLCQHFYFKPQVAKAVVPFKEVVPLLLVHWLLLLPLFFVCWGFVFGPCCALLYLMFFLILQPS